MKKPLLLILTLMMVHFANGQITFQKAIGGIDDNQGYCIEQTTDGGYIIAGKSANFGLGYSDIFIIKTDANGDTLWTKAMGSTGIDVITSVRQTSDGGFIFAGVYAPPPSYSYAFLMKTTVNGNILWTQAYGNSLSQDAKCVQQTSDGGYIVCGNFVGTTGTSNDYLLLKTNSTGVASWAKSFGSNNSDFGYYVEQTNDGGYVFTGFGSGSIEVIKTDGNGNFVWSKNYGSGIGNCVRQTTDGGYAIAGYASGVGLGSDDIILKKTDSFGNVIWAYRYGGVSSEKGHTVSQTSDSGYIISGTITISGISKLLVVKTDSAGNLQWSKVYGSSGFSQTTCVQQTTDGGYIVLGKYGSTTNNSIYIVKTDSSGISGCNQADTTIYSFIDSTLATTVITTGNTVFLGNPLPAITVIEIPSSTSFNSLCFSNAILELPDSQNDFIIYPNPSNGNFTITFKERVNSGKVEVINTLGENVYSQSISNSSMINIQLNKNASGIYLVKAFNENEIYCKKLFVK